jgi:hypothetical protein
MSLLEVGFTHAHYFVSKLCEVQDVNAEVDKNREVAQQLLEKKEALRTKQRTLHEINAETETNEQNLHKLEQKVAFVSRSR